MNLADKITSIRQSYDIAYVKPSVEKLEGFIKALKETPEAIDYLRIKRGLSEDTITHFNLGYDVERHAIAIPVYKRGELINIRYRLIDPQDKSKYTQEKGAEVWMYNEDGISKGQDKKGILIVEGEFDLMSCWQAGIKNVISPASGKDSYGVWIELMDTIPRVYIAYDNDKPGKKASYDLADRIGIQKCFEVIYPTDIKDANEYFMSNNFDDYRKLISNSKAYYRYTFNGMADVIELLRTKDRNYLKLDTIPFMKFKEDWMVVLSGDSGIGKTTFAMNIVNELASKNIPSLTLPFERGIKDVGERLLQIKFEKTEEQFEMLEDDEWKKLIEETIDLPVYFSRPDCNEVNELLVKAKKLFGIKVVIIDHLDYLITEKGSQNQASDIAKTLQDLKALAQDMGMIFIIVHHIKMPPNTGTVARKPRKEDLKSSSSTYQVPEGVIMLSEPEPGKLMVDIVKNKGEEGFKLYEYNKRTGKVGLETKLTNPLDDF